MGTARAKFRVTDVQQFIARGDVAAKTVELTPVYSTDPSNENRSFLDATPYGRIRLTLADASLAVDFEIGAELYVEITRADEAP